MKTPFTAFIIAGFLASQAFATNVDLTGVSSGTLITAADGSSFAESFAGQSISGTALTGSPSNPLTLQAGGSLTLDSFNGFNTILPQPGNAAPLALLLAQSADSISWQMGYADSAGPITINFYDGNGNTVHSVSQALTSGYATYSFSGFGTFAGLAISDNVDPSGLRFYDFEYNPVGGGSNVPDSGSSASLLLLAFLPLLAFGRRVRFPRA